MIADFSAARRTAESAFVDECEITRDPEGGGDDYRDYGSGEVVAGPGDAARVYLGPCMWRPVNVNRNAEDQAGASMYEQLYRVRLPMSSPEVKMGDGVKLVRSQADPVLAGTVATVVRINGGTGSVTRILTCGIERRGPDR